LILWLWQTKLSRGGRYDTFFVVAVAVAVAGGGGGGGAALTRAVAAGAADAAAKFHSPPLPLQDMIIKKFKERNVFSLLCLSVFVCLSVLPAFQKHKSIQVVIQILHPLFDELKWAGRPQLLTATLLNLCMTIARKLRCCFLIK
jgi:hypothetical protein